MDSLPDPIGDLLDLGGVAKTAETRSRLNQALEIARASYELERERQQRAPSELFEQLDTNIKKTLDLITKLGEYPDTRDIAFAMHPIGTGIADAVTGRKMIEGRSIRVSRKPWVDKGMPHISADHVIVGINVENLLRAFRVRVGKARRKKRGHPERTDKLSVAFYAANFFCRYWATKPSRENDQFRLFVERFFEVATGTKAPDLEWQVRQVLKRKSGGEKQPKKDE
jgi:hypothetical protein